MAVRIVIAVTDSDWHAHLRTQPGLGIALSSTVHWLFDRHLISLDEQYRLLVAHNRVPPDLRALFHEHEGRIHLPADPAKWPSQEYVAKHRERYASA